MTAVHSGMRVTGALPSFTQLPRGDHLTSVQWLSLAVNLLDM